MSGPKICLKHKNQVEQVLKSEEKAQKLGHIIQIPNNIGVRRIATTVAGGFRPRRLGNENPFDSRHGASRCAVQPNFMQAVGNRTPSYPLLSVQIFRGAESRTPALPTPWANTTAIRHPDIMKNLFGQSWQRPLYTPILPRIPKNTTAT